MSRTEIEMRPSKTADKIDAERNVILIEGFNDLEIRRGFVTKVYSILTFQLLLTLAIIVPSYLIENVRVHLVTYVVFYGLGPLLPILALILVLGCRYSRKFPQNLLILFTITILWSISIAAIVAHYKGEGVLIALGIVLGTFILVTFVSATMKVDVTGFRCIIGMIIFMLIMFVSAAILGTIFMQIKLMMLLYSAIGCVLSVLYIAIDTQLIVGGKRKNELSPEDYVLGALMIYTDILRLFLYIIELVGSGDDDDD